MKNSQLVWEVLRIVLGWTFVWPFFDKVFGLGFATAPGKGWLDGVSPTVGFLKFGTKGPFAEFFQSIAGNPVVDWLFMLGILGVGLALLLGIGIKIASISGIAILLLIYVASAIWPEHNPVVDDHIINSIILAGIALSGAGKLLGLGNWWANTRLVKALPILR